MAEPADETKSSPFDFSQAVGAMQDRFGALKSQWEGFLDEPGAKTALLQFGINMMQPPSFGDTAFSQMGRALGGAGEAIGRREELERREFEAESKADLRSAQADAAEARASGRIGAAGAAEERAKIARERLEFDREKDKSAKQNKLISEYLKYQRDVNARNTKTKVEFDKNILKPKGALPPTPEPVLPYEQWLPQFGPAALAGVSGVPPAAAQGSTMVGGGGQPRVVGQPTLNQRPSTGAISPVPPNPKDRIIGQTYTLPNGTTRTWFADGWE